MKTWKLLAVVLTGLLLLAACGKVQEPVSPLSAAMSPLQEPALTVTPPLGAAVAAVKALAQTLNLDSHAIKVLSAEKVMWPDSCLGLHLPNQMCAQVITPGYKVILEANGQRYEYHTDESGRNVRQVVVGAALKAQQALAQQLKIEADAVKVISAQEVQWPDGCLGIHVPNQACTLAIVPGYKIVLEAGNKLYTYHTNQDGSIARLASESNK